MDLLGILQYSLESLGSLGSLGNLGRQYNPLEQAMVLSDTWKNNARLCRSDLQNYMTEKVNYINELTEEEGYDYRLVDKEMKEIDQINSMIIELDDIIERNMNLPLASSDVEKICAIEMYLYKQIMSDNVRQKLLAEIQEQERKIRLFNALIDTVDRMWDDNQTEEAIKEEILKGFREIYPNFEDSRLMHQVIAFYNYVTQGKNVRVNLTNEQIAAIKREAYQGEGHSCGTCLEELQIGEEVMILPCSGKHSFHPNCIIPWLKMSVRCPTCRSDLRD